MIDVKKACRCACGYTCGGPGSCDLEMQECINQHFKRDCDHDFKGDMVEVPMMGAMTYSLVCQHCGLPAISHDVRVGP